MIVKIYFYFKTIVFSNQKQPSYSGLNSFNLKFYANSPFVNIEALKSFILVFKLYFGLFNASLTKLKDYIFYNCMNN